MELLKRATANGLLRSVVPCIAGQVITRGSLLAPCSATGSTAVVGPVSGHGSTLRWPNYLKPTALTGANYSIDNIADQDLFDYVSLTSHNLNAGVDVALMLWHIAKIPPPSGARVQVRIRPDVPRGGARVTVKTPADLIAEIKAAFGLSLSQVARVMNVQRPTIYAWLDEQQRPDTIRAANKARLVKLADVAALWRRMSPTPSRAMLDQRLVGGKSLVEWLAQGPLSEDVVIHILEAFASEFRDEQSRRAPSFAERLSAKGFVEVPTVRRGPLER